MACKVLIGNYIEAKAKIAALNISEAKTFEEASKIAQKFNADYNTPVLLFKEIPLKSGIGSRFITAIDIPQDLLDYLYNKEEERTPKPAVLKPTIKIPKDNNLLDWATKQYESRSIFMEQPTSAEKKEYNKTCGK